MADITVQQVDDEGKDLNMAAASAGGDSFTIRGDEIVIVTNNDASDKTVTIAAQTTDVDDRNFGSLVAQDKVKTASANGGVATFPYLSKKIHADSNGKAQITYSDVTSTEIAVIRPV